jgi:hypothetical protein
MKTNIQHFVRIVALSLILMVSMAIGFTDTSSTNARICVLTQPQVLLAACGDGGQESHGGKGSGGGGHTHG